VWDLSGCPAYVENWGRNTVTNSLSNLVAVTEKRACKAAPKNRREWDPHQNWPSCMPYLEVSKSINLHDNKTHTCINSSTQTQASKTTQDIHIVWAHIRYPLMIDYSFVYGCYCCCFDLPQKMFWHLCFWFILNLKGNSLLVGLGFWEMLHLLLLLLHLLLLVA
jgi:hypothetical protein